jgi:hypothetical protein
MCAQAARNAGVTVRPPVGHPKTRWHGMMEAQLSSHAPTVLQSLNVAFRAVESQHGHSELLPPSQVDDVCGAASLDFGPDLTSFVESSVVCPTSSRVVCVHACLRVTTCGC